MDWGKITAYAKAVRAFAIDEDKDDLLKMIEAIASEMGYAVVPDSILVDVDPARAEQLLRLKSGQ